MKFAETAVLSFLVVWSLVTASAAHAEDRCIPDSSIYWCRYVSATQDDVKNTSNLFRINSRLVSQDKRYNLAVHTLGNLAVYKNTPPGSAAEQVWQLGLGSSIENHYVELTRKGEVRLVRPSESKVIWSSGFDGGEDDYHLVLENDTALSVYRGATPETNRGLAWTIFSEGVLQSKPNSAGTKSMGPILVSPNGRFTLFFQSDGNNCIYPTEHLGNPSHARCKTGIAPDNAAAGAAENPPYFAMQPDGNLVSYQVKPVHKVLWQSATGSSTANGFYFAQLEDRGELMIYRGNGPSDSKKIPIWGWDTKRIEPGETERIVVAKAEIVPCTRWEFRQLHNAKVSVGKQVATAYLVVNKGALYAAKTDVEQCIVASAAACAVGAWVSGGTGCVPAAKTMIEACLTERGVSSELVNSIQGGISTTCYYD